MYKFYNPNPNGKFVGDCVIRAICKIEESDWDSVYLDICMVGFKKKDMPSDNDIWELYLYNKGYRRGVLPDTCPDCYTVDKFCQEHPKGKYLLATGRHVVAVVDGDYYDAWDSGKEVPVYYWHKEVK